MKTWCLQELMATVPALQSVPIQPLLLASHQEYGMFEHFKRFHWYIFPKGEQAHGAYAVSTSQ